MSDVRVAEALRSDASLVLVEAPAGCGKTYQGAEYAKDLLPELLPGRLLILTHTHAACDVFAERVKGCGGRVEIRTIHSLVTEIAEAYHEALDLPADVPAWAMKQGGDGFGLVALKVADLLTSAPVIALALATRYPCVVCDEHQDSTRAQHQIILSMHHAGARLRVFGDQMQAIYLKKQEREASDKRWLELQNMADRHEKLETPHRWKESSPELGDWIGRARSALGKGDEIDLRGERPPGVILIRADNAAESPRNQYRCPNERRPIDDFVDSASELLVLASTNHMVGLLRPFFNRRIPIWEGHTRNALSTLVIATQQDGCSAVASAEALIKFVQTVARGFSDSRYAKILRREVAQECSTRRNGMPAKMQEMARLILGSPGHRGIARGLARLDELIASEASFGDIKVDMKREFREATRLDRYDDAESGLSEIAQRRTALRLPPPRKAISTVHKAKGLERENVLLLPCDRGHFSGTEERRRLLYVALSRATRSLALVVPRQSPSPLFRI